MFVSLHLPYQSAPPPRQGLDLSCPLRPARDSALGHQVAMASHLPWLLGGEQRPGRDVGSSFPGLPALGEPVEPGEPGEPSRSAPREQRSWIDLGFSP